MTPVEKPKNKRGRGRPPKPIDLAKLEYMASIGCTYLDMATIIGCSDVLLKTKYFTVINAGKAKLRMNILMRQMKAANDGNVAMLIWLGKQHCGQTESGFNGTDDELANF